MSRDRLEKLLGMLGSAFDGERSNAAKKIADMAAGRKLSIVQMIEDEFSVKVATVVKRDWAYAEAKAKEKAETKPNRDILDRLDRLRRDGAVWMSQKDSDFVGALLKRRFTDEKITQGEMKWTFDIFQRYGVK